MVNWKSWEISLLQDKEEESIILSSSFLTHNRSIAYSIKESEHFYRQMQWMYKGWFTKYTLKERYVGIYDEIESHISATQCPNEERLKTLQRFIDLRIHLLDCYCMGLVQVKSIIDKLLRMQDLLSLWGNEFLELYSYTRFCFKREIDSFRYEIITIKYIVDVQIANKEHDILGSTISMKKANLALKEWRKLQNDSENPLYSFLVNVLAIIYEKHVLNFPSLFNPNESHHEFSLIEL